MRTYIKLGENPPEEYFEIDLPKGMVITRKNFPQDLGFSTEFCLFYENTNKEHNEFVIRFVYTEAAKPGSRFVETIPKIGRVVAV
jgi:hypothetical protein